MASSDHPEAGFEGVDGLAEDFARQRALIGTKNPVIARMLHELEALLAGPAVNRAIVDRLERAWRERRFGIYYERPLLLVAALRADAAATGDKHPLARALRDEAPDAGAATHDAIAEAMRPDAIGLYLALATRRVQTNEVSRAVVWRWLAHLAGCDGGKRPLALVDIGASGGLNLVADALPATWTERRGHDLTVVSLPRIVARIGYDRLPLDFMAPDDVAWGRACIWPGDRARLEAFDAAVQARRALADEVQLSRVTAGAVPAKLPAIQRALPDDAVLFVFQTLVREYLEPRQKAQYLDGMHAFIARSTARAAAWIELEVAPDIGAGPPAAITAHFLERGQVRSLVMASCSYHPTELAVRRAAVDAFVQAFRA